MSMRIVKTMMKKTTTLIFVLLSTMILSSACSNGNRSAAKGREDSAISGDYNLSLYSEFEKNQVFAQSPKGVYFILGSYLFFMPDDGKEASPLCYKPECLHLEETDENRIADCDAFVGGSPAQLPFISYYKDHIYLTSISKENGSIDLIRMKEDGSEKETIVKDLLAQGVMRVRMHRGVIYYHTDTFSLEGVRQQQIWALPVDQSNQQPEAIYTCDEQEWSLTYFLPYGNQLFFSEYNDDYHLNETRVYRYDTETGQVERILDEEGKSWFAAGIYKDHLIVRGSTDDYEDYDLGEKALTKDEYGIMPFVEEHTGWNCHIECFTDTFRTYVCYDRENGEMINDLIITDEKGVEKAVIPDEAWLLSSSIVVTIDNEDYYIRGCNDASNFSVKKYKCSDLLAGAVDPVILFEADAWETMYPPYVISNQ